MAPWALKSCESQGRVTPETPHAYRTAFQRDRDRVVHSRAFRRLEYKTQVFVYREDDHYRNRLTHTLEGAQISRTIARVLRLNEELAEVVVLAHDLGHTPFGHAGERVLDELMSADGGFDHNRQSLRVVDLLEESSSEYRGLNLTYESREGLLKHGCDWEHPVPVPSVTAQPSLESQMADFADEIAYTNHDIDDGLRSGLIAPEDLGRMTLWCETTERVRERFDAAPEPVIRAQSIRFLIDWLVTDLVDATSQRLARARPADVNAVRTCEERLGGFSPEIDSKRRELKHFLHQEFYLHPRIVGATHRAEAVLGELFQAYRSHPNKLPEQVRRRFDLDGDARATADYIAGMTDRFALQEHARLTGGPQA
ncbi:deoxyguanosinetriphosphate triphosphohydrolase [Myxococcota bacterium]|nr:deoxyguanosinetriphosphate triphosphohydrolase [Myxococcota bacterium]